MIKLGKRDKRTNLDKEIDSLLEKLKTVDKTSEDYATMIGHLTKLTTAKSLEPKQKVSPDTKALIGGNLLGIVLILCYEKADVITSKALGFVLKGRA